MFSSNVQQIDAETRSIIGMAAILANEPSCLRAAIGKMSSKWIVFIFEQTAVVRSLSSVLTVLSQFYLQGMLFVSTIVSAIVL